MGRKKKKTTLAVNLFSKVTLHNKSLAWIEKENDFYF